MASSNAEERQRLIEKIERQRLIKKIEQQRGASQPQAQPTPTPSPQPQAQQPSGPEMVTLEGLNGSGSPLADYLREGVKEFFIRGPGRESKALAQMTGDFVPYIAGAIGQNTGMLSTEDAERIQSDDYSFADTGALDPLFAAPGVGQTLEFLDREMVNPPEPADPLLKALGTAGGWMSNPFGKVGQADAAIGAWAAMLEAWGDKFEGSDLEESLIEEGYLDSGELGETGELVGGLGATAATLASDAFGVIRGRPPQGISTQDSKRVGQALRDMLTDPEAAEEALQRNIDANVTGNVGELTEDVGGQGIVKAVDPNSPTAMKLEDLGIQRAAQIEEQIRGPFAGGTLSALDVQDVAKQQVLQNLAKVEDSPSLAPNQRAVETANRLNLEEQRRAARELQGQRAVSAEQMAAEQARLEQLATGRQDQITAAEQAQLEALSTDQAQATRTREQALAQNVSAEQQRLTQTREAIAAEKAQQLEGIDAGLVKAEAEVPAALDELRQGEAAIAPAENQKLWQASEGAAKVLSDKVQQHKDTIEAPAWEAFRAADDPIPIEDFRFTIEARLREKDVPEVVIEKIMKRPELSDVITGDAVVEGQAGISPKDAHYAASSIKKNAQALKEKGDSGQGPLNIAAYAIDDVIKNSGPPGLYEKAMSATKEVHELAGGPLIEKALREMPPAAFINAVVKEGEEGADFARGVLKTKTATVTKKNADGTETQVPSENVSDDVVDAVEQGILAKAAKNEIDDEWLAKHEPFLDIWRQERPDFVNKLEKVPVLRQTLGAKAKRVESVSKDVDETRKAVLKKATTERKAAKKETKSKVKAFEKTAAKAAEKGQRAFEKARDKIPGKTATAREKATKLSVEEQNKRRKELDAETTAKVARMEEVKTARLKGLTDATKAQEKTISGKRSRLRKSVSGSQINTFQKDPAKAMQDGLTAPNSASLKALHNSFPDANKQDFVTAVGEHIVQLYKDGKVPAAGSAKYKRMQQNVKSLGGKKALEKAFETIDLETVIKDKYKKSRPVTSIDPDDITGGELASLGATMGLLSANPVSSSLAIHNMIKGKMNRRFVGRPKKERIAAMQKLFETIAADPEQFLKILKVGNATAAESKLSKYLDNLSRDVWDTALSGGAGSRALRGAAQYRQDDEEGE